MMELLPALLHYLSITLVVTVTAFGVSLGQGATAASSMIASNQQPHADTDIKTVMLISMALTETTALIGLVVALALLSGPNSQHPTLYASIAQLGIACAICFTGLPLSLLCAKPSQAACAAIARQPLASGKIVRLLLLSLSILQTPLIFAFIISLLIRSQAQLVTSITESLRLVGAGLSIGLGSVGPIIGLALLAQAGCRAIGINRASFSSVMIVSVISQAFVETPILLSLVISLFILFTPSSTDLACFAKFAASICISLGTITVGISSGKIAATVCNQLAEQPDMVTDLSRIGMFSQAFVETCTLYAFIIAVLLVTT